MGEHPEDKTIEQLLEEEAKEIARKQAELETEQLRYTVTLHWVITLRLWSSAETRVAMKFVDDDDDDDDAVFTACVHSRPVNTGVCTGLKWQPCLRAMDTAREHG